MENFKTETITCITPCNTTTYTQVTHTQEGYSVAPIVNTSQEASDWEILEVWQEVVSPDEFREALALLAISPMDITGFYWCVRRTNGKMYPFPLLYADADQRKESAERRNAEAWRMFYAGYTSSSELDARLVDCPSEQEVEALRASLKEWADQGETPWDHLDQRGGLIPRWAA